MVLEKIKTYQFTESSVHQGPILYFQAIESFKSGAQKALEMSAYI